MGLVERLENIENTIPTEVKAVDRSREEITTLVEVQSKQLVVLDEVIDNLYARISPILKEDPEGQGDSAATPVETELGRYLLENNDRLSWQIARLKALINRVAL